MIGKESVRKIEKVVINVGVGRLSSQPGFSDKVLPTITQDLAVITGQKPSPRPALRSVSGFKLREGAIVGLKTTLRRQRMAQFLNKIISVVLPRVRDFRGLDPKNIDENGNLSFGVRDHLVFPEVTPETSKVNFGLEITVVPRAMKNREEAVAFYKEIGVPFQKHIEKHG